MGKLRKESIRAGFRLEGTSEVSLSNPLLKQGHPEPPAQEHIQKTTFTVLYPPMKIKDHRTKMNDFTCN